MELANRLADNYARRPSSLAKMFGSNGPTPEQKKEYDAKVRAHANERSRLQAAHKVALERDNKAFRGNLALPNELAQKGITPAMLNAYREFHSNPLRNDPYGHAGGTTLEKAAFTRAQNKAIKAAQEGTSGHEDPVFRLRWNALSEHFRRQE